MNNFQVMGVAHSDKPRISEVVASRPCVQDQIQPEEEPQLKKGSKFYSNLVFNKKKKILLWQGFKDRPV